MIIWGSRGDTVNLGDAGNRHCEVCEKERRFNYILHYRYFHLDWIFGMITQKEYLLLCEICNRGWKLDSGEIEKRIGKIPIPFMQRYGLLTLSGIIFSPLLLGSIINAGIWGFVFAIAALAVAGFILFKRRQLSP